METNFFIDEFLDIELELEALDYHLNLIEKQINNIQAFDRLSLEKKFEKLGITRDDSDWQIVKREFDNATEYFVPRIFRYPFIISLYAVYESAVIEAANLLQEKRYIQMSINDLKGKEAKGGFIDKAKRYFEKYLVFPLCPDKKAWERIKFFVKIRHNIAHANGRIENSKEDNKTKGRNKIKEEDINRWEKTNIGISEMEGYIVLEDRFLRDTFKLVRESLNDLIKRYRTM
jgi:hypothetical protein